MEIRNYVDRDYAERQRLMIVFQKLLSVWCPSLFYDDSEDNVAYYITASTFGRDFTRVFVALVGKWKVNDFLLAGDWGDECRKRQETAMILLALVNSCTYGGRAWELAERLARHIDVIADDFLHFQAGCELVEWDAPEIGEYVRDIE